MYSLFPIVFMALALPAMAGEVRVETRAVDDFKPVIATVEPGRLLTARARISGRGGQASKRRSGASAAVVRLTS